MSLEKKMILWVDVGTHFGQEYNSIFGGYIWFFYKIFRRLVGSIIFRKGNFLFLSKLIILIKNKFLLKKQRQNFFVLFVEANPKILRKKIYSQVESISCLALGGKQNSKLGDLFFVDGDETGQGSSIFTKKGNINANHSIAVNIVSPEYFANHIKEKYLKDNNDYKIILRINCEGSEDEVIYAFKKIFGEKFSDVFGSLKDVKGVKGEQAYQNLIEFMKRSKIKFTDFSSSVISWPIAFDRMNTIVKQLKVKSRS